MRCESRFLDQSTAARLPCFLFCKGSTVKTQKAKSEEPKSHKPKQTAGPKVPAARATVEPETSIKDAIDEQRSRWMRFLAKHIALDIFRSREAKTQ